ncbi:MAG: cobalt-precorrin-5B (C(1))-methyltransferase [Nitrospirae bacterium]|nr:cobalt-precorrin-5B (C(1))-methyltransferase [Nitrospirota bacterium]
MAEQRRGLRTGYSTGACATAAARAALQALLTGLPVQQAEVILPQGERVLFPVAECRIQGEEAACGVIKDAGDDPDVTHGALILATVSFTGEAGRIDLVAGEGVGVVTRPGLGLPVGVPDITRVPRQMMTRMVQEMAGDHLKKGGVRIVLSIPGGEERARKTELLRLGVVGGLAILGTTGIVKPYSTAAYRAGIRVAVRAAAAQGFRRLVITTGGMSERFARKWIDLPEGAFIQMGDFVGHTLRACVREEIEKVTISGMIGKLSKMAQGTMQTHAAGSEVDMGFLAGLAAMSGAAPAVLEEIRRANTARQAAEIAVSEGVPGFFELLCHKVCEAARRHVKDQLIVECLLTDFEGGVQGRACLGE